MTTFSYLNMCNVAHVRQTHKEKSIIVLAIYDEELHSNLIN
jgi:hypothetical protein